MRNSICGLDTVLDRRNVLLNRLYC